jgi:hypothetical protein
MFFGHCASIKSVGLPYPLDKRYHLVSDSSALMEFSPSFQTPLAGTPLDFSYLKALMEEAYPLTGTRLVLVTQNEEPYAAIVFQRIQFSGENSFRLTNHSLKDNFKKSLGKWIDFNALILGNAARTGNKGFVFLKEGQSAKDKALTLNTAMSKVVNFCMESEKPLELLVVKDIEETVKKEWMKQGVIPFHPFEVEPHLVLNIAPHWKNFDNYLQDLSSKYRIRAKRVRREFQDIEVIELVDLSSIRAHEQPIQSLYQYMVTKAEFNLLKIHSRYFEKVKRAMGDQFRIFILKREGQILGFLSYFLLEDALEAHYVGYEEANNVPYRLYHNLLFLFVEQAIAHGKRRIDFGRTACEIKTSVGAVPEQFWNLMSHRSKWVNPLVPRLIRLMNTQSPCEQRHPFKIPQYTAN